MQTTTAKAKDLEAIREVLRSLVAEGRVDEAIEAALAMLVQLRDQNTDWAAEDL